ncbi:MAG: serine/threonine-protein kinase, partial [Acidobacteriota bacterium]
MTPDRWKRIEELYHAARTWPQGDRAAFLSEACRDDEALQRDVESLLNESVSDDGFLGGPAGVMAARSAMDVAPAVMTGRSIGGYHLQMLLGAGGMGEVYRSRDVKLERDVAVKILPRAFTSDPDRLARFEREARMLAALNHPNICAIYGLEEADGLRFLILELVDGETLAQTLEAKGGALPIADALAIARQIADALEAAHEKGIIHRDLKPANITISPDGAVKVLDFGLAKADRGDGRGPSPTVTIGGTQKGLILGTAAYMSPEQARGKGVDKRADIWAFGCVLYEMLTGRTPFPGETVSDTIGKILEREPEWSALP